MERGEEVHVKIVRVGIRASSQFRLERGQWWGGGPGAATSSAPPINKLTHEQIDGGPEKSKSSRKMFLF